MKTRGSSKLTNEAFIPSSVLTITLPAIPKGRSIQVEKIGPPYTSVFSFWYLPFSIVKLGFSLKVGESKCAAVILKETGLSSGITKAAKEDIFLPIKYFPPGTKVHGSFSDNSIK